MGQWVNYLLGHGSCFMESDQFAALYPTGVFQIIFCNDHWQLNQLLSKSILTNKELTNTNSDKCRTYKN